MVEDDVGADFGPIRVPFVRTIPPLPVWSWPPPDVVPIPTPLEFTVAADEGGADVAEALNAENTEFIVDGQRAKRRKQ